jgi:hypothetical protein
MRVRTNQQHKFLFEEETKMPIWGNKVVIDEGLCQDKVEYEEKYDVWGYVAKDGSGRTLTYEPGGYLKDDRGNVIRNPNY